MVTAVMGEEISGADLATRIATGHRNYARRQLTWFRRMERQGDLEWLSGAEDDVARRLREISERCLSGGDR